MAPGLLSVTLVRGPARPHHRGSGACGHIWEAIYCLADSQRRTQTQCACGGNPENVMAWETNQAESCLACIQTIRGFQSWQNLRGSNS